MNRLSFSCMAVMVTCGVFAAKDVLVSGQPLRVRANGGVGLLATPEAIKSVPVGCAKVFGGKRPDLFVSAPTGVQQALYLYRWVRDTPQGQPVFAPPLKVILPWGDATPPDGTILQDESGVTHALWLKGKDLIHCRFERDTLTFREAARFAITGLPRPAISVTVLNMTTAGVDVVVACYNGAKYRPEGDATNSTTCFTTAAALFAVCGRARDFTASASLLTLPMWPSRRTSSVPRRMKFSEA